MAVKPVVRYMLLCDDVLTDPNDDRRASILGLISNIRPDDDPPYPMKYPEMCVFLALTEMRGQGLGKITCIHEESGRKIFETPARPLPSPADPLEVVGVTFRIRSCPFPNPGLYSVQFWFEGQLVEERPLRLR